MRRRELLTTIADAAEPIYGRSEAIQIGRMVLDELCGVSATQLITAPNGECKLDDMARIIDEIERGRPIQYIIGEADFCDARFKVREGVLIPRPESEELVQWIVSEGSEGARVLDIGTGSGALAISIARLLEGSRVTALDLSQEALTIARENINRLAPWVETIEGDALRGVENYVDSEFDIILSNPPYIPQSEEQQMRINVTHYEPHIALFVPDNDPLLFYRAIGQSGLKLLKRGGKLYFELHEDWAVACRDMLSEMGYTEVTIKRDINDKNRMICALRD